MKIARGIGCSAIVVVFLILGDARSVAETKDSRAAGALFQQFETVFQVKTNLLPGSGEGGFVRRPFAFLLDGLGVLDKQLPKEVLSNTSAILVGTKDYMPPEHGLGMVRSTSCYILVLGDKSGLNIGRYFKQQVSSVSVGPVWHWSASLAEFGEDDQRPSSLYTVQIAQSYLLVSNNLEELESVAARLKGSPEADQALASIRDWRDISQHSFWGYRQLHRVGALSKSRSGVGRMGSDVEALVVYADSRQGTGTFRLISSKADNKTAESMNAAKYMPQLTPRGPGVWEATVPLTDDGHANGEIVFGMLWLFGCGAVI